MGTVAVIPQVHVGDNTLIFNYFLMQYFYLRVAYFHNVMFTKVISI